VTFLKCSNKSYEAVFQKAARCVWKKVWIHVGALDHVFSRLDKAFTLEGFSSTTPEVRAAYDKVQYGHQGAGRCCHVSGRGDGTCRCWAAWGPLLDARVHALVPEGEILSFTITDSLESVDEMGSGTSALDAVFVSAGRFVLASPSNGGSKGRR
jgi:hypothetical protein